jgi:hypothetical protein
VNTRSIIIGGATLAIPAIALVAFYSREPGNPRAYNSLEGASASPGSVQKLRLEDQGLIEVPEQVRGFPNLFALYLAGNRIRQVPGWVTRNPRIRSLSLGRNALPRFPPELAEMANLCTLELDGNAISELPPTIGGMTSLETLDLRGNKLARLPAEIGDLGRLDRLLLDDNRLARLPPEIGRLSRLEVLDLSNNELTDFPSEIADLRCLRSLRVGGNRLSPEVRAKLQRLLPSAGIEFVAPGLVRRERGDQVKEHGQARHPPPVPKKNYPPRGLDATATAGGGDAHFAYFVPWIPDKDDPRQRNTSSGPGCIRRSQPRAVMACVVVASGGSESSWRLAMLLLVLGAVPAVCTLWSASLLSRTPRERLAGLAAGIFGAAAPYAGYRVGLIDALRASAGWFPQGPAGDGVALLCTVVASPLLALLGVVLGVWAARLVRWLLGRRWRGPAVGG